MVQRRTKRGEEVATGQAKHTMGRRGTAGENQPAGGRAGDGLSLGTTASRRTPSPCFVFRGRLIFLFNVLALDFFGRLVREY